MRVVKDKELKEHLFENDIECSLFRAKDGNEKQSCFCEDWWI